MSSAGEKGVHVHDLHLKYNHSPGMFSWFIRTFAKMIIEKDGQLFLNHKIEDEQKNSIGLTQSEEDEIRAEMKYANSLLNGDKL